MNFSFKQSAVFVFVILVLVTGMVGIYRVNQVVSDRFLQTAINISMVTLYVFVVMGTGVAGVLLIQHFSQKRDTEIKRQDNDFTLGVVNTVGGNNAELVRGMSQVPEKSIQNIKFGTTEQRQINASGVPVPTTTHLQVVDEIET